MAYNVFDNSSTTLTPAEASSEAKRILERLAEKSLVDSSVTSNGCNFVARKLAELKAVGSVSVTTRELLYLRDINYKVD